MASLIGSALGFLICLLLGMAFSAMEFASVSLNRIRLLRLFADEHMEPTCEQEIFRETKSIYFLSRLGLFAALAGASYLAYGIFKRVLEFGNVQGQASSFNLCLLAAILAFALAVPAYIFVAYAIPRLLFRPLAVEQESDLPGWIRFPLRLLMPWANFLRRLRIPVLMGMLPHRSLTKADLVALVTELEAAGPSTGAMESEADGPDSMDAQTEEEEVAAEEIIYNILDLEETYVREIMKPINSVIAIRLNDLTPERVRALARSSGYSRFPIYRERIVNLIGHISVYDILQSDPTNDLEPLIRPAYFVPEFMRVSTLLQEFLEREIQVAVAVDEYGGCSGWITREDVFEEIVGVFDPHTQWFVSCEDGSYLVNGTANISDVEEELPVHFAEPQYDTLAGFLLEKLEFIPVIGDAVTTEEAVYTVEKMEGNRIQQVRIRLLSTNEGGGGKDAISPQVDSGDGL